VSSDHSHFAAGEEAQSPKPEPNGREPEAEKFLFIF